MKISFGSDELVLSGEELLGLLKDVQEKGGSLKLTATGHSMKPSICHGNSITISPVTVASLKKGDIVLFRKSKNSQITVHRVVKIKGKDYLMKGDNSDEDDGWISGEMILGLITGIERNGKLLTIPGRSRFVFYHCYLIIRRKVAKLIWNIRRIIG